MRTKGKQREKEIIRNKNFKNFSSGLNLKIYPLPHFPMIKRAFLISRRKYSKIVITICDFPGTSWRHGNRKDKFGSSICQRSIFRIPGYYCCSTSLYNLHLSYADSSSNNNHFIILVSYVYRNQQLELHSSLRFCL